MQKCRTIDTYPVITCLPDTYWSRPVGSSRYLAGVFDYYLDLLIIQNIHISYHLSSDLGKTTINYKKYLQLIGTLGNIYLQQTKASGASTTVASKRPHEAPEVT